MDDFRLLHVIHIWKAMTLNYHFDYLETILVHPMRHQSSAGTSDSTFYNIWNHVILYIPKTTSKSRTWIHHSEWLLQHSPAFSKVHIYEIRRYFKGKQGMCGFGIWNLILFEKILLLWGYWGKQARNVRNSKLCIAVATVIIKGREPPPLLTRLILY